MEAMAPPRQHVSTSSGAQEQESAPTWSHRTQGSGFGDLGTFGRCLPRQPAISLEAGLENRENH